MARHNKGCKEELRSKEDSMHHSTVTSKGQTTIPRQIRLALKIKPGDTLQYALEGDQVIIRVHPGLRALKGALASRKGRGRSFAEVRKVAALRAASRWSRRPLADVRIEID